MFLISAFFIACALFSIFLGLLGGAKSKTLMKDIPEIAVKSAERTNRNLGRRRIRRRRRGLFY